MMHFYQIWDAIHRMLGYGSLLRPEIVVIWYQLSFMLDMLTRSKEHHAMHSELPISLPSCCIISLMLWSVSEDKN